jgi:type IV pilus assembly protein PilC
MDRDRKIKGQIKSAMIYPTLVVVVGVVVIYVMMTFVVPKLAEMIKEGGQELPWITQMVLSVSEFFRDYSIHIALVLIALVFLIRYVLKTKEGREFFDSMSMKAPIFGAIIVKGNLASFSRTLSTMLSAGISLVDALSICIETVSNVVMARDLVGLKKAIVEGKTLTEGLVKIEYFPAMVAQMVGVGEQTGNVDNMLVKVAEVFEEQVNNLVANMTKMIEPIIIVVLGGVVAVIMVAMYMPIFVSAGGIN